MTPDTTSNSIQTAAPGARPFWRRPAFIYLTIVVSLVAGVELAARVYDGHRHFRFQLLKVLDELEGAKTPIPAAPDASLEWPARGLFVRDAEFVPPPAEPYVLGGKVIPGAQPDARQKFIQPGEVAAHKRIVILGESAAFGFPLTYGESFAAQLEQRLKSDGYAVLNAAQPAWTSGQLVPVAHRIVDYFQPETLILYLGNLELEHGRFGLKMREQLGAPVATVESAATPPDHRAALNAA